MNIEVMLTGIDKIKSFVKTTNFDLDIFRELLAVSPSETDISALAQKAGQKLAKAEKALFTLQERVKACQLSKGREIMQENGLSGNYRIVTKIKNSLNGEILKGTDISTSQRLMNEFKNGYERKRTKRNRTEIRAQWLERIRANKINLALSWNRENLCLACGITKNEIDFTMGTAEKEVILDIIAEGKKK